MKLVTSYVHIGNKITTLKLTFNFKMNKQFVHQWTGCLVIFLLIVLVLTISYRNANNIAGSTSKSHTDVPEHSSSPLPIDLQCQARPTAIDTQKSRYDAAEDIPDWLDERLRLNSSQTRIFPFPKVYDSAQQGLTTRLSLKPRFQMHFQYDGRVSVAMVENIKHIVDRVCHDLVSGTEPKHAAPSLPVTHVHVTFTSSNLLATSSAMKDILHHRTEEVKRNAQYIDDEMYTLDVSEDGVVYIMVHTSTATGSAPHRGLANAFSTLEQLVNQAIPVKLPLSIIDWPDNHWRG